MKDLLPPESTRWHLVEEKAREHFGLYQYEEVRTPILENTELFVRSIGTETGVVQKEMYTFDDKGGDSVTLRPEGTASVVRAYIENSLERENPILKFFYIGPMFRYERPQKGRLRQFHQIGCELFGSASPQADVEVIAMLDALVQKLGVPRYELQINSLGCQKPECRPAYLKAVVNYFTSRAAEFCPDCQRKIEKNPLRVFDCKNEKCQQLAAGAPIITQSLCEECHRDFDQVKTGLDSLKVAFKINERIVRGLDYYNKTAFELISDQLGSQSAFAGGGRYDGLVASMGGSAVPAVGFAIGLERLMMLVPETLTAPSSKKVTVVFLGAAAQGKAYEIAAQLRAASISTEISYEEKSLKAQMRRADKIGSTHGVILGEDEIKKGVAQVKDFTARTQQEVALTDLVQVIKTSTKLQAPNFK